MSCAFAKNKHLSMALLSMKILRDYAAGYSNHCDNKKPPTFLKKLTVL
jgi:hypothetical protein